MNTRQTVVLVSGLSGAGKASILNALADLGFEAVDNPPLELIEGLVRGPGSATQRLAIGVDARSRGFDADAVLATIARLRADPALRVELVYAWAEEQVLLRRYTESRRRHPLAPQGRVTDGILAEQQITSVLHAAADLVLDTSDLPLAAMRQKIEERFNADASDTTARGLSVALVSFAFPAGLPREADIVLDARFLRNPHYVQELRPLTGCDVSVVAYVETDPDFAAFFAHIVTLLSLVLPRFVQEGKKYATIAIGCTGGRHRSVVIVERLATHLLDTGWRVSISHRELAREDLAAHGRMRPPDSIPCVQA